MYLIRGNKRFKFPILLVLVSSQLVIHKIISSAECLQQTSHHNNNQNHHHQHHLQSQTTRPAENRKPTTANGQASNGVDDLMRETFQLLDDLDQSLANVNNRTPSALMRDNLRSLASSQSQLVDPRLDQRRHKARSLVQSLTARNDEHQDDGGDVDDDLVKLASSFSSGRKSPGIQSPGSSSNNKDQHQQHEETLLMASTDQQQQQQHQQSASDPNKRARLLTSGPLDNQPQQQQQHRDDPSQAMLLSENDSTERHIKFAINLMQAVFFANQAAASGGGVGSGGSHSKSQQHQQKAPSELQQLNSVESFLVSPLSIQMVLMMLQLGARGQTRRELNNCLHLLTQTQTGGSSWQQQQQLLYHQESSGHEQQVAPKLKRRQQQQQQPSTGQIQRLNPQQQQQQQKQTATNSSSRYNQLANGNNLGVHELFAGSMRNLLKDPIVMKALTSANQIFLQKNLPLSPQFEWALRHYYGADLRQVDFQHQLEANTTAATNKASSTTTASGAHQADGHQVSPSSQAPDVRQMINDWVERQTRGRIVDFLGSAPPSSTLLMAINVLFFRGDWQYKFDPADTQPDSWFTLANGKTVRVPMMVNRLPLAYAHDAQLRASMVELPYKAQRLGLFVLLPDEAAGILHAMRSLNSTSFANLISAMRKPDQQQPNAGGGGGINIRIPKFTIESAPRMSQILSQQLGLKSLFSPDQADLSGMFASSGNLATPSTYTLSKRSNSSSVEPQQPPPPPPQVGLDELLHKAILQVDEQGSVAAAASATAIERIDSKQTQYFEADHPFLLFLMDKQTGLVLFSGVYAGPASGQSTPVNVGGQQAQLAGNATAAAAATAGATNSSSTSTTSSQHQVAPASSS